MTREGGFGFLFGVLLTNLMWMLFGPRRGEFLDTPKFPDDHDIEVKEANHDHH